MVTALSTRTKVFISYSHADEEWLNRLSRHLKPLAREGRLDCWDDTHIRPGDDWKQEIQNALDMAQVAVLLISADFFASDFIDENELPPLLDAAQAKGVRILPVILSASQFDWNSSLARFQTVNPPDRPLAKMPRAEQEEIFNSLARTIMDTTLGRPSSVSTRQADANRHGMLVEVRRIWIDGYLKPSLHNLVRIELGLAEKADLVSRPWDLIMQQSDREPRPLPPNQAMSALFDELGQALLILGAPGAGKTTLLLELARDLLDRAEQDINHPIPVVFHLAFWAVRRRPLADWLVDELTERYYVSRGVAQAWTDAERVLPLLDGLDEVAPEHRAACVAAINTFRHQYGRVPLAVCCREADYQALSTRLELSGAVIIQPLSRVQVSTYLKQAGKLLAGVRMVLRYDETLWELLETPLMLSIVTLAYQGQSAAEVRATGSLEERRRHLFKNYTKKMFERRSIVTEYTPEQTTRWLTWLAQCLMHNNLSIFYVEWMQPDWLPSRVQRWLVAIMPIIFYGLFLGLVLGLLLGLLLGLDIALAEKPELMVRMLVGGLIVSLVGGLVVGLVVGLVGALSMLNNKLKGRFGHITPAETLRWSWRRARRYSIGGGLVLALANALVGKEVLALVNGHVDALLEMLRGGLRGGLVGMLVGGLVGGLTPGQIVTRTIPNEGIRRSLRNALISFLTVGLSSVLVLVSVYWDRLVSNPAPSARVFATSLGNMLFWGLAFGLVGALVNGGSAYIKHHVLRILLWYNDYAPWKYIRFLDCATERVFLRKVGGGYIFTHRLLMEYFATLHPTNQAEQAKTE